MQLLGRVNVVVALVSLQLATSSCPFAGRSSSSSSSSSFRSGDHPVPPHHLPEDHSYFQRFLAESDDDDEDYNEYLEAADSLDLSAVTADIEALLTDSQVRVCFGLRLITSLFVVCPDVMKTVPFSFVLLIDYRMQFVSLYTFLNTVHTLT